MYISTENKKMTQHRDKSVSLIGKIRSIQEDLLYASFYGEEKSFEDLLSDLARTYRDLYSSDQFLNREIEIEAANDGIQNKKKLG